VFYQILLLSLRIQIYGRRILTAGFKMMLIVRVTAQNQFFYKNTIHVQYLLKKFKNCFLLIIRRTDERRPLG